MGYTAAIFGTHYQALGGDYGTPLLNNVILSKSTH